jgi:hypothetical protein
MAEPGHQTRAGSELPGLLIPGLVPPLLGILDFVGKRLRLRQGVRPSQLSMLAIQADPVQVIWTADSPAPKGLVNARLVYLGHADGVMALYDPPRWGICDIDPYRGVVWRVNDNDATIRVEVDPPTGTHPGSASRIRPKQAEGKGHGATPGGQDDSAAELRRRRRR